MFSYPSQIKSLYSCNLHVRMCIKVSSKLFSCHASGIDLLYNMITMT